MLLLYNLGSTFNLTINLVEDTTGNAMSNVSFNNIAIPDVDFQGTRGTIGDWFEIQASKSNPSPGETIHITVYHKNVCGYLTGSNNTNKNADLGSSTSILYTGIVNLTGSPPTSVDLSSGRADFDITIDAGVAGQTVTIRAQGSGVDTTQILTLSIP